MREMDDELPLYGEEDDIVLVDSDNTGDLLNEKASRIEKRQARELQEDGGDREIKKVKKLEQDIKDAANGKEALVANSGHRFRFYIKYDGRFCHPLCLKIRLPLRGSYEHGPSFRIKKLFVDQANRLREVLSIYRVHLRSELGIVIPDEDALISYVGHGGVVLVCDGSAPNTGTENTVFAWGGTIFNTADGSAPSPMKSLGRKRITNLACGLEFAMASSMGGRVFSWGVNDFGQLGTGDENSRALPTEVEIPYEVYINKIACGHHFSMGLTKKGELWTWGRYQPSNYPRFFVDTWANGCKNKGEKGLRDIKIQSISGGMMHMAAVGDGKVFTWGYNDFGQLGWGTSGVDNMGQQKPTQLRDILENEKIASVSCGGAHTIVITTDQKCFAWGSNVNGQLGLGYRDVIGTPQQVMTSFTPRTVECGFQCSMVIDTTSKLHFWGALQPTVKDEEEASATNMMNAPVSAHMATDCVAMSAGDAHGILATTTTCVGFGYNRQKQAIGKVTSETFVKATEIELDEAIPMSDLKLHQVAAGGSQSYALAAFL